MSELFNEAARAGFYYAVLVGSFMLYFYLIVAVVTILNGLLKVTGRVLKGVFRVRLF